MLEVFAHDIQRQIRAKAYQSPLLSCWQNHWYHLQRTVLMQYTVCRWQLGSSELHSGLYQHPRHNSLVLVRLNPPMERLKCYCFDGASSMSGRFKGVQARLKEMCPDSVFVDCTNHSLDLVLQEVAKEVHLVADALNFMWEVTVIINYSVPIWMLWHCHVCSPAMGVWASSDNT